MVNHRQFLPKQDPSFGFHWHLPLDQQKALTRYSKTRRHIQLVRCIPTAFQKATYVPIPSSLVVKVKQNRLIWSTDFGRGSRYNEAGNISHCHEPYAQLVKGAIMAMRKMNEITAMYPSVTRIVVATDLSDLVKKAAWKEDLDGHVNTRLVRQLHSELEAEIRALEMRGCCVQFWLQ